MTKSMTAFAKCNEQSELGIITWEIRSVNGRFLDLNFRLPEALRELELEFRQLIKQRFSRGKVDITLRYQAGEKAAGEWQLNESVVKQLKRVTAKLDNELNLASYEPLQLLRWPGLLLADESISDDVKKRLLATFTTALDELAASRSREGSALVTALLPKLEAMSEHVVQVRKFMPELVSLQRQRLSDKLAELKVELDPERIEQEIVLFAQKVDVIEELDRLTVHIDEMSRLLQTDGVMGRRLDFLAQEMHREANTLGSKSAHQQTSKTAFELKLLIEQIREQVQNIE